MCLLTSSDYAAQLVARAIEHVAAALVEEEEASGSCHQGNIRDRLAANPEK